MLLRFKKEQKEFVHSSMESWDKERKSSAYCNGYFLFNEKPRWGKYVVIKQDGKLSAFFFTVIILCHRYL